MHSLHSLTHARSVGLRHSPAHRLRLIGHGRSRSLPFLLRPLAVHLSCWPGSRKNGAAHPDAAIDRRRLRYLKDWHLVLTHPHYDAYSPPLHFVDDWMNRTMHGQEGGGDEGASDGDGGDDSGALDDTSASAAAPGEDQAAASVDPLGGDDFRFCSMGSADTWTPMHTDVSRGRLTAPRRARCCHSLSDTARALPPLSPIATAAHARQSAATQNQ